MSASNSSRTMPGDRNKPQPVSKVGGKVKVSERCSETWTLLRLLPLMLSVKLTGETLVGNVKSKWNILTLIRIVQLLQSDIFIKKSFRFWKKPRSSG